MAIPAEKTKPEILFCICLLLALAGLFPIVRATRFLLLSGVDIPSNDDVIFLDLISRMSASNYNWLNYFRDTLINGHCFAVGLAIFWLNCKLTAASQTAMIAVALLLLTVRVVLMNDYIFGKYPAGIRLAGFSFLSLLLFAPSQTAVLAHPTFAVTWQLALLTSILSLWLITKWPDKTTAKLAASVSTVIGSWTAAISLAVLPLLFVQNFINGTRKARGFLWVTATALASLAPYLVLITIRHNHNRSVLDQIVGFDSTIFINILGRPFANGTGTNFGHLAQSFNAGLFGLFCAGLLFLFALTSSKQQRNVLAPSLFCLSYGLLTTALVATTRSFIAPTNSSISSLFWCGLVGLAIYCFHFPPNFARSRRAASLLVLACILVLTVAYSKTFEDKQYYLDSRAPFSASLVQHYAQAPTYATRMVFKLVNVQPFSLGVPLERNGWSVFAPHREYLLQGDFALPTVELERERGGRIFWIKHGHSFQPISWKNYAHLDLALQGESKVFWRVNIPARCRFARLHCRLLKEAEGGNHSIIVRSGAGAASEFSSPPGEGPIDLTKYSGQQITVCLQHRGAGTAIFVYPRVEIMAPADTPQEDMKYAPANVVDSTELTADLEHTLRKVDDQRISIFPKQRITSQEFQSLDFLATGKPGLVNCVVAYKKGPASVFEIPILGQNKPSLYIQPGRIFDDNQEEIVEISLVNNGPGILSDYVSGACLRESSSAKSKPQQQSSFSN